MTANRILVVGDINVDLVLSDVARAPAAGKEVLAGGFTSTLGGASAITAVGLARLGDAVSFVGKVGEDTWGKFCLDALTVEGVDVSGVRRDRASTTGVTVSISTASDRALVTHLGAIAELTAEDIEDGSFVGVNHLHVSSFFLQSALRPTLRDLFARAHQKGLSTSLDSGFDPQEAWGRDLIDTLTEVDFFFPNETELKAITATSDPDEGLRRLANGRTTTIVKRGRHGATCLRDGRLINTKSFSVDAIDTTGAGDSFNAGFLHSHLGGASIETAMRYAAACGALSTLRPGGTAGQPRAGEVDDFLRRYS